MPTVLIKKTGSKVTITDAELAAWKKSKMVAFKVLEDDAPVEVPEVINSAKAAAALKKAEQAAANSGNAGKVDGLD